MHIKYFDKLLISVILLISVFVIHLFYTYSTCAVFTVLKFKVRIEINKTILRFIILNFI